MTTKEFAYWLQGYFEISGAKELDERQVEVVKDHLALVFTKVTPDPGKHTNPLGPSLPIIHPMTNPNILPPQPFGPIEVTCESTGGVSSDVKLPATCGATQRIANELGGHINQEMADSVNQTFC